MEIWPNVILMTIDSLRADHVSCLGYSNQITPNIDNLAKKGALFSQVISNGAGSVTSFPSIMTSTYSLMNPNSRAHATGTFWVRLSDKHSTIAEVLKSKGYSTVAFINRKMDISSIFGYHRGFDDFNEFLETIERNSFITWMLQKLNTLRGNKSIRADIINEKAIVWLKNHRQKPFFLWLHYMDVHTPPNPKNISVLKRTEAIRLGAKIQGSSVNLSAKETNCLVELYDQEIRYVDNRIGILFDRLAEMDITLDNTYFILLSDHGDQFMEHGEWGHGRLYDEVIHVPLIISGPDIKENTLIENQVSLLDLAPTIIDLLKIPKIKTFLGKSLLPLLDQKVHKQNKNYVISEELTRDFSCRTDNWKYIIHDRTNTHELYNLRTDPKEKMNLASKHSEKVKELNGIISKHTLMEERVDSLISKGRDLFSSEEMEILKKYPKKDIAFLSKVFGIPRAANC